MARTSKGGALLIAGKMYAGKWRITSSARSTLQASNRSQMPCSVRSAGAWRRMMAARHRAPASAMCGVDVSGSVRLSLQPESAPWDSGEFDCAMAESNGQLEC